MKFRSRSLTIVLVSFSIACSHTPVDGPETTATPLATVTLEAIRMNETVVDLPTPFPGTVVFDFSEDFCSASWSNNGEYLPCPGNSLDIKSGYVDRFDEIELQGDILITQPGLLTIPAQQESQFQALFGKYPPFTVEEGDRFRAMLACSDDHPDCDAILSLEYYDAKGVYSQFPGAEWNVRTDEEMGFINADVDLSNLTGQIIQFSLSIRDNGDAQDDYVVWILPHITRPGLDNTDAPPSDQIDITQTNSVTVSGIVDMQSAPPYLYDDHPPGSPAAVVFFNASGKNWYTVQTSMDSAEFTIDIIPGEYFVLAYAQGIGDLPYMSGAYTGVNPSCGNPMAVLQVFAGKPIYDIKINDWNWSCGRDAKHLEKPEEIALP